MSTKIRLQRGGAKKKPFYRIVVTDTRSPRDGKFIEKLGTFDPVAKDKTKALNFNKERVEFWLKSGAEPSERVAVIINNAGVAANVSKSFETVLNRRKVSIKAITKVVEAKKAAEAAKAKAEAEAKAAEEAAAKAAEAEDAKAAAAAEAPAA